MYRIVCKWYQHPNIRRSRKTPPISSPPPILNLLSKHRLNNAQRLLTSALVVIESKYLPEIALPSRTRWYNKQQVGTVTGIKTSAQFTKITRYLSWRCRRATSCRRWTILVIELKFIARSICKYWNNAKSFQE